jgi:hypothetical protein
VIGRFDLERRPPCEGFHLEMAIKPLRSLGRIFGNFSKSGLKSLNNQANFDPAIRRFESWRAQPAKMLNYFQKALCVLPFFGKSILQIHNAIGCIVQMRIEIIE